MPDMTGFFGLFFCFYNFLTSFYNYEVLLIPHQPRPLPTVAYVSGAARGPCALGSWFASPGLQVWNSHKYLSFAPFLYFREEDFPSRGGWRTLLEEHSRIYFQKRSGSTGRWLLTDFEMSPK